MSHRCKKIYKCHQPCESKCPSQPCYPVYGYNDNFPRVYSNIDQQQINGYNNLPGMYVNNDQQLNVYPRYNYCLNECDNKKRNNCHKRKNKCRNVSEVSDLSSCRESDKSGKSQCQSSESVSDLSSCDSSLSVSDKSECESRSSKKHKKSRKRKCRCECPEVFPCLKVKCGFISANLVVTTNPQSFSTAGQVITYNYTITNTGSATICYPIQIVDNRLGSQYIPNTYIQPGASQSFMRTYTILQSDVVYGSISDAVIAYIQVKSRKWVATKPASVVITTGGISSNLTGTITQNYTSGRVYVNVVIVNNSPVTAQDVMLTLNYPPGTSSFISGSFIPPDNILIGSGSLTLLSPFVNMSQNHVFQFSYVPTFGPGNYTLTGTLNSSLGTGIQLTNTINI